MSKSQIENIATNLSGKIPCIYTEPFLNLWDTDGDAKFKKMQNNWHFIT